MEGCRKTHKKYVKHVESLKNKRVQILKGGFRKTLISRLMAFLKDKKSYTSQNIDTEPTLQESSIYEDMNFNNARGIPKLYERKTMINQSLQDIILEAKSELLKEQAPPKPLLNSCESKAYNIILEDNDDECIYEEFDFH